MKLYPQEVKDALDKSVETLKIYRDIFHDHAFFNSEEEILQVLSEVEPATTVLPYENMVPRPKRAKLVYITNGKTAARFYTKRQAEKALANMVPEERIHYAVRSR